MNTVYLHIGLGKTGSSSLQAYLSSNPVLDDGKQSFAYCCLLQDGQVLSGAELKEKSSKRLVPYLSSISDVSSIANIDRTRTDLMQLLDAGCTPILSQESWGRKINKFVEPPFLDLLGCKARIIVYVRPQVEWFNSGWWQWWAWMPEFSRPAEVLDQWGSGLLRWAALIDRWSRVPGVIDLTVRLHPKDIVQDFLQVLGNYSPRKYPRVNVSLAPEVIKLLLKFSHLRGPDDSHVDIILADVFGMRGAAPWMVDETLGSRIIATTRDDNIALAQYLDVESKAKMAADPRWWDYEYFADRRVWTQQDLELTKSEYETLMAMALPKLISLARQANRRT